MTDFETDLAERFERSAARLTITDNASAGVRSRLRRQQRRRTGARIVGGVATAAVVVGGLVVVRTRDDADQPTAAGNATAVVVTYEQVAFHEQADLTCPGAELDNTGNFTDYTLETWSDTTGRRWRTTVTYPDDTTRTVIAFGSFYFDQTGLYVDGIDKGAHLGCVNTIKPDDKDAFALTSAMPGLDGDRVFSMNPPHENPAVPDPGSTDPDTKYPPLAISSTGSFATDFRTSSTQQPGVGADSQGRPAVLWQSDTTAELSGDYGGRTSHQTARYYVDPTTTQLTEIDNTYSLTDIGTSTTRTTLLSSATLTVNPDVFSTTGFQRVQLELTTEVPEVTVPETSSSD
jgi:hypothetical protein